MLVTQKPRVLPVECQSPLEMVAYQSIFVRVIIASSFRFENTGIIATEDLWSTNETDHLLARGPDLSGSTTNSSDICPPETMKSTNDSSSSIKICLRLCCPFGETRDDDNCIKGNATLGKIKIGMDNEYVEREVSSENFHVVPYDPCRFGWSVPSKVKNFHVLRDGSIHAADSDKKSLSWDYEHYCLFQNSRTFDYEAKVCYPFVRKGWWEIVCATIFILVMLPTFIVYAVVPKLKNLHGMIFRSYVATYIVNAICVLAVEFTAEKTANADWYIVFESGVRLCCCSCLLWLNVMSFNIWRSLRDVRAINCNTRKYEREKYTWYAIYAWVIPAVVVAPGMTATFYIPVLRNEANGHLVKIWSSTGVVAILYSSNAFLYILTTRLIRQHKKNTAWLSISAKRHHDNAEQWFKLHLKLFLIMGGHIIVWVIWLSWPTPTITHLVGVLEVMQALLIFFIFVWKDNIKQSFYEQFK